MSKPNDEGEPQMDYLYPAEGGSYHRQADGSLRRASAKAVAEPEPEKAHSKPAKSK